MTIDRAALLQVIDRVKAAMERESDRLNAADGALGDGDRDRPATVGRARIFTDKSRGLDDPGMLAIALIVEAVADLAADAS